MGSAPLPHRSVANIRSPGAGSASGPSTPLRGIQSSFGSPSSLRADEDLLLIELGTRKLHIGFTGDPVPRGSVWFGPDQQRRVGDFRVWLPDYKDNWKQRAACGQWGQDHELWKSDVRGLDLGLVSDKIERAVREALTKWVARVGTRWPVADVLVPRYMLIDSRPRRMVCVLPSGLPIPMLSTTLDTLFGRFAPPTISLLSIPIALVVGAGVRSALVIDLGWSETVVTGIYEYREVHTSSSIRGGRMLTEQTHKFLAARLGQVQDSTNSGATEYLLSFEECDEIACRLVWCKPSSHSTTGTPDDGLATVDEQDETDAHTHHDHNPQIDIPLRSCEPPTSLSVPFDELTEPCENAFFDDSRYSRVSFDDHELPVHILIYRALLQLPLDVRALCMSRIIFTGGCANVLGLRKRIFDDVSHLIQERGWDPVMGKGADEVRKKSQTKAQGTQPTGNGGGSKSPKDDQNNIWHDAANTSPDADPIEEQLKRAGSTRPTVKGEMRAIESLGPWPGASLITQLKAPAIATVDRDIWQQQGAAGASRATEVDPKGQRQSLGPGGLIRGAAASWTLGVWGAA